MKFLWFYPGPTPAMSAIWGTYQLTKTLSRSLSAPLPFITLPNKHINNLNNSSNSSQLKYYFPFSKGTTYISKIIPCFQPFFSLEFRIPKQNTENAKDFYIFSYRSFEKTMLLPYLIWPELQDYQHTIYSVSLSYTKHWKTSNNQ